MILATSQTVAAEGALALWVTCIFLLVLALLQLPEVLQQFFAARAAKRLRGRS